MRHRRRADRRGRACGHHRASSPHNRPLAGVAADDYAAVEAVFGSVGQAICSFETDRLKPLGSDPPTRMQRMFAEWQLGDPTSSTDAWRPWKRLNRSHRTRPVSEGGQAPG